MFYILSIVTLIITLFTSNIFAATQWQDEGVHKGWINKVDCVGDGLECTALGIKGTVNASGMSSIYLKADGTTPLTDDWDAGSHKITAEQLESDVATGTAPLIITSTTQVTNLNVSNLEGTDLGTLTDTKYCVYDSTNTEIDCNAEGGGAETNNLETVCTDIAVDEVPVGTAADTAVYKVIADCDSNGNALNYDTTGHAFSCKTLADADIPNDITIDLATAATTLTVADTTDSTSYIALWESATGNLAGKSDAGATYDASTGDVEFGGSGTFGTASSAGESSTVSDLEVLDDLTVNGEPNGTRTQYAFFEEYTAFTSAGGDRYLDLPIGMVASDTVGYPAMRDGSVTGVSTNFKITSCTDCGATPVTVRFEARINGSLAFSCQKTGITATGTYNCAEIQEKGIDPFSQEDIIAGYANFVVGVCSIDDVITTVELTYD